MVMMIWVVRLWIRYLRGNQAGSGGAGAVCFWDSRDRFAFGVLRPGDEMLAVGSDTQKK